MPEASSQNWTSVLTIRPEVAASDGGVGDLQMSLHRAVYQTARAPYQDVVYYADITQPTPNLVGFFGRIARRLSGAQEPVALFHLDQGMGGGKSHALVGLYHMASNPSAFFQTHVGREVLREAEAGGTSIALDGTRVVTLTADHFSPGKATETFGPAISLFERFLWSLFEGDRARYDAAVAEGANKATIQKALSSVGKPVLILLDELMDYVMELSAADAIGMMPSEQAFLNALMDACDDVPRVAFVLVMIRSELDPEGYSSAASSFREYLAARINRNGATVPVTEAGDFAAILRRRIFNLAEFSAAAKSVADEFRDAVNADTAWEKQVLDRLGSGKGIATLRERVADTYPFHPELMDLVRYEWGKTQGFQRVRSTVAIFALAALHWTRAAEARGWAPALIGVGDLPLGGINGSGKIPQARCLEALLNSGLLIGNDRAIQGYRAVATTDVTSADGQSGQAVEIDKRLAISRIDAGQPHPAVRMATALFNYSLVPRSQGKRGANKAELMAALLVPTNSGTSSFVAVEEVFTALTGVEGLGALESIASANNQVNRYWLTIKQTLKMFFNAAKSQVFEKQSLKLVWETVKQIVSKGQFGQVCPVDMPEDGQDLGAIIGAFDAQENRLLLLDPRRWTLLNGEDPNSRNEICRMLGVGNDAFVVENGASCVVAVLNTYQRRYASAAAQDVLTWEVVADQVMEDEERGKVADELAKAQAKLRDTIRRAYRHFAYQRRIGDTLEVFFAKIEDDKQSTLSGNDVWTALVLANRAVGDYVDPADGRRKNKPLSEEYVAILLSAFERHLTLRDVVSSFSNNPRFPLVPTIEYIRNAVFGMIQPAQHAGEGTGGWEIVGSDGSRLYVATPGLLAISSAQQQIRKAEPSCGIPEPDDGKLPGVSLGPSPRDGDGEGDRDKDEGRSSGPPKPRTYSWYKIDLTNRSVLDEAKREDVRKMLLWLASVLDRDDCDPQLVTLKYELMAGTDVSLEADLRSRAQALGAKTDVSPEEA